MATLTIADFPEAFNDRKYVERALKRIAKRTKPGRNGCVECDLSLHNGYSTVWFYRRTWCTHRLMWLIRNGEIPEGLVIDHLCRNPKCYNLDHLELVTDEENRRRGNLAAVLLERSRKKTCSRGHPYTDQDYNYRAERTCIVCRNDQKRARYWSDPAYRAGNKARAAKSNSKRRAVGN